jgi:hypothetical protein
VGDVSYTTTITYGSEHVFNAASTLYASVAALSSTKFVVAYTDGGNSSHGTAIVGDVSDTTTITYGSEHVFNSANTMLFHSGGVAPFSATEFVVGYENTTDNDGRVIVGTVSGNTISYGNQTSFNAGSSSRNVTVVALSNPTFVVAWDDESDSNKGKTKVGSYTPTSVTLRGFTARPAAGMNGFVLPLALVALGAVGGIVLLWVRRKTTAD